MVVRAVMNAWLISRQQFPSRKQQLPQFPEENSVGPIVVDDDFDDDAAINVEKRSDIVPARRGRPAQSSGPDGFRSNALFWKGIVFGLLAVVLVKMVFEVKVPFGIDWYLY
ncbi:MAG: hypothetical protein ACR2QF_18275 [Geminicoccaceae bacterium]